MQTKKIASAVVRLLPLVASLAYLYNVYDNFAKNDIPADTTSSPISYGDRFYDRVNPDGRTPNLHILGVTHTLRAFSLDREHILSRLQEADIVLLERFQAISYPSVGEGTLKENDYFLQIAAWAIKHGKAAYFIDTRLGVVTTILVWLGAFSALLTVWGTSLLAIQGWRARKFPIILCVVGLLFGVIGFPGIAVTLVHGLGLGNDAALPLMGVLDYSPISDGFSVQLSEREAVFARGFPEKRIAVVVGNSHAVVADYYNRHPCLARFKHFVASLWQNAPVTEVLATEVSDRFIWRIPERLAGVSLK